MEYDKPRLGDIYLTMAEWARRTGIKYTTLRARIRRGIPFEDAIEMKEIHMCCLFRGAEITALVASHHRPMILIMGLKLHKM